MATQPTPAPSDGGSAAQLDKVKALSEENQKFSMEMLKLQMDAQKLYTGTGTMSSISSGAARQPGKVEHPQ